MIKRLITILFLLIGTLAVAQDVNPIWTVGTACTLNARQFETGLLQRGRYGITRKLEVQSFFLADALLMPNIHLKKNWLETKNYWYIATRHGLYVPNISTNMAARNHFFYHQVPKDTANLPTRYPFVLAMQNELLVSKMLVCGSSCAAPNYLLTLKLGLKNGLRGRNGLYRIDFPMVYHETVVLHKQKLGYVGVDLDAWWLRNLNYFVDLEFKSVDFGLDEFSIEHKAGMYATFWTYFRFVFGYQALYAQAIEHDYLSVAPFVDFMFRIRFDRNDEKDLFKHKMLLK